MKEIKAFITTDGKLFTNKEAAENYEYEFGLKPQIQKFLNSTACEYHGAPQKSMLEKTIVAWIKWSSK